MSATAALCDIRQNDYRVIKSDPRRLCIVCPDANCSFSIYATAADNAQWKIKTIDVGHSCDHCRRKHVRKIEGENSIMKAFVSSKTGSGA